MIALEINMYVFRHKLLSLSLVLLGLVIFSGKGCIFDYLVYLMGPEKLVGQASVIYTPEGCFYTNPRVMALWTIAIAALGIIISSIGLFSLFRELARCKKRR